MQHSKPLTLVVTVDVESGPRRKSANLQLAALGWPFQFVQGLTPQSPETVCLYDPQMNRRRCKRPLAPVEVAAYASHRKAMREFLDTEQPLALVLEDDFRLLDPAAFTERMEGLLAAPVEWDILKLFDFQQRPVVDEVNVGDVAIVSHGSPTAGMVGYLITRQGAEKMLSRPRVYRQIDEDIKYFWELKLRVLSVRPNLVTDISERLGGSLLEADRNHIKQKRHWTVSVKALGQTALRQINYRRYRNQNRLKFKSN
ncbi:glycosyltransferase family 25 protein [Aminobacter sp. HY435]|uniref:glycosyltransferase family 25 protein n=1 Tax=Aminobacter sp. HY435 TaxID=2970917 RepID=UPI0022B95F9D|nr:glycosyltransferase family 25 protein [Aminobacter sp. HY435]